MDDCHSKSTSLGSIASSSAIYGAANVFQRAIPFLLLPILSAHLTSRDFGMVAMFAIVVGILTPVIGCNVHGAINRGFFDGTSISFPQYIWNGFVIVAIGATLTAPVLFVLGSVLANILWLPQPWLWCAGIIAVCQSTILIRLSLWQARQQPSRYAFFQCIRAVLSGGTMLLLVCGFEMGWRGVAVGQLITAVTCAAVGGIILLREGDLQFNLDRAYMTRLYKFGMPLILHSIGAMLLVSTDRLFISNWVSLESTGLYFIAYQVGLVINLGVEAFHRAWQPWLFEQLTSANGSSDGRLVRITYFYFASILLIAVSFGLLTPYFLPYLISNKLVGAGQFIVWIAIGYAFNGMYKMVAGYIFYTEKTGYLAAITAFVVVANVLLNAYLVPKFGAIGAAISTTTCFLLAFCLSWIVANRVRPMPWFRELLSIFKLRKQDEPKPTSSACIANS